MGGTECQPGRETETEGMCGSVCVSVSVYVTVCEQGKDHKFLLRLVFLPWLACTPDLGPQFKGIPVLPD